jgi:hypothetical protein
MTWLPIVVLGFVVLTTLAPGGQDQSTTASSPQANEAGEAQKHG